MIILLIKGKLFQTDQYFPFLAAIKRIAKDKKIKIIYPSLLDYKTIKKNKLLFKSLQDIAKIKHFYATFDLDSRFIYGNRKGIWYFILGIISVLHRFFVLNSLFYKKVSIISTTDVPKINWIVRYNQLFMSGRKVSLFLYPYSFKDFKAFVQSYVENNRSKDLIFKNIFNTSNDFVISCFSKEQLISLYPRIADYKYKIYNIGNNWLKWKSWQSLLNKNSQTYIKKLDQKFIFFPLATLKKNNFDYVPLIKLIINKISKIENNIQIVIRPHPTTNISKLKKILLTLNHKNIIISYIAPLILVNKALFTIRYGMSILDPTIIDQKKLLIRFYSKDLYKRNLKILKNQNKQMPNLADVVSPKKLEKKILEYLNKKSKKNYIKLNYVIENNKLKPIIDKI